MDVKKNVILSLVSLAFVFFSMSAFAIITPNPYYSITKSSSCYGVTYTAIPKVAGLTYSWRVHAAPSAGARVIGSSTSSKFQVSFSNPPYGFGVTVSINDADGKRIGGHTFGNGRLCSSSRNY